VKKITRFTRYILFAISILLSAAMLSAPAASFAMSAMSFNLFTAKAVHSNNDAHKSQNTQFDTEVLSHTHTPLLNTKQSRMDNIILTCDKINETVISPYNIFSFNEVVGERTEERGYQSAPTFVDGKIAESLGGGICQVSSTLYYACLLANLEIIERQNHSMLPDYVSIPGFDATVYWDSIDFKFRNNSITAIKILSWIEDYKVHVKIMGVKQNNNTVIIEGEIISTNPAEIVFVDNPSLAPGQINVLQPSFNGYVVDTYRKVINEEGKLLSLTLEARSIYNKLDKIVEYNFAKVPEDSFIIPSA